MKDKRDFEKFSFPKEENPAHGGKMKKPRLDALETERGTLPVLSLLLWQHCTGLKQPMANSLAGERESSECLASPAVQDVTGETHFFPAAPRELR